MIRRTTFLALIVAGTASALPAPASAAGADPGNCPAVTPAGQYRTFSIGDSKLAVELRYSAACAAGWGRIQRVRGKHPLRLQFTAWNPGGPSQDLVPGRNYTYTVDGTPGSQICAGFHAWTYDSRSRPRYAGWHFAGCYTVPGAAVGSAQPAPAPAPAPTPAPSPTWAETTGGVAHTWTNYTNAGGAQGPSIGAHQTVAITCKVTGFRVADGNTWWYRIASPPWNGQYYVSADAFYNNGQTSGSLIGTPFVDPAVASC